MAELKRRGGGGEPTPPKADPFKPAENAGRRIGFDALKDYAKDSLKKPAPGLDKLNGPDRMQAQAEIAHAELKKLADLYLVLEKDPSNKQAMVEYVDAVVKALAGDPSIAVTLMCAGVAALVEVNRGGE